MTNGEKIKYYRTIRGISQKTLAILSGVSEGAIRKYEAETRNPKHSQLAAIANALGISENIFIDLALDTPSDLLPIFYKLDELYDITFDGKRDEKGNIDPKSLTLHFSNDRLNKLLSQWAIAKRAVVSTEREKFDSDEVYETTLAYSTHLCEEIKNRILDSQIVLTSDSIKVKINPEYNQVKGRENHDPQE